MKRKWHIAFFMMPKVAGKALPQRQVVDFANEHHLKPGEIIVLGEDPQSKNGLIIMYYSAKEIQN